MKLIKNPKPNARGCLNCEDGATTYLETETEGRYCSLECTRAHFPAITPAFSTIMAESLSVGLPRLWKRDLTLWDRKTLSTQPSSVAFFWILREHGTHLIIWGKDGGMRSSLRAISNAFGQSGLVYVYEDEKLVKVDWTQATAIAQEWDARALELHMAANAQEAGGAP